MVEISNASLVAYADDCSRTSCDPPLRGGVKISTGPCSGGFVAADTIEPPANSFYLLTAGHCADAGDVVRQDTPTLGNGRVVGVVTSSHNSGGVDAAAIAVGSTFLPADTFGEGLGFWDPSRWVVHDNNTLAFQIRNKVSLVVGAAEGTVVCRSGWKSTDCGEIVSAASFPTLGDAIGCFFGCILGAHMMFLETDLCSIGGDSGGPVYTRHTNNGVPWTTAFGIHSRSQNSGNTSCPVAEHSFHTHIAFAERSLAVNVWCAQRCGNV